MVNPQQHHQPRHIFWGRRQLFVWLLLGYFWWKQIVQRTWHDCLMVEWASCDRFFQLSANPHSQHCWPDLFFKHSFFNFWYQISLNFKLMHCAPRLRSQEGSCEISSYTIKYVWFFLASRYLFGYRLKILVAVCWLNQYRVGKFWWLFCGIVSIGS